MIAGIGLEQIDSILDQLESLSHQEQSRRQFYNAVLARLRLLLNAHSTSYWVRLGDATWICLTSSGPMPQLHMRERFSGLGAAQPWTVDEDHCGLVVSVNSSIPNQVIAIRFDAAVDELACQDLVGLIQAFAELLDERNHRELNDFLNHRFVGLQRTLAQLAESQDLTHAATIFASDAASILAADRVSLVQCRDGLARILAVSGRASQILPTEAAGEIEQACLCACESGQPVIHVGGTDNSGEANSTSLAANFVACPLSLSAAKQLKSSSNSLSDYCEPYVLIEWTDCDEFMVGLTLVPYFLPTIAPIWKSRTHSLGKSAWGNWLSSLGLYPTDRSFRRWIRPVGYALGIALVCVMLTRPVEFRIEMEGTLEPALQRTVYAAHDGYIEQLTVDDNSDVKQGQLVAAMRSPKLDLDLQEIRGELRANQEKHNALSLSLNQFGSDTADSQAKQQTLGSELKQLEIQKATLEARLLAIESERQKLNLVSPIDGVIVSREMARLLDSRPIRRGDAVMRVADPKGKWRLALKIKDADAGHLRRIAGMDLGGHTPSESESLPIDFVIVSQPDTSFKARLAWLSSSARNPDGQGVILDAIADIEADAVTSAHIGATAQAYIRCGTRPFWYVWSRPLWEAIQRKLWF